MTDRFNRERRQRDEGDEGYSYPDRQRMERDYGRGQDFQQEGRFGRGDYDRGEYRGGGTGRGMGAEFGPYGRQSDYEDDLEYGAGYGRGGYERGDYGSSSQGRGSPASGWGGYPGTGSRSGSYGRAGGVDEGTFERGSGRREMGQERGEMGYYDRPQRFRGGYEGGQGRYGGDPRGQQTRRGFSGGQGYEQGYGRSGYESGGYGTGGYGRSGYEGSGYDRYDEPMGDDTSYWTYSEVWYIPGPFTGAGPEGYQRSDERIFDDVCERLSRHGQIDASGIHVDVEQGNVTLRGTVPDRHTKRMAEDVVEQVMGVQDVQNELKAQSGRSMETKPASSTGTLGNQASARATGSATSGSTTSSTSSVQGSAGTGNSGSKAKPGDKGR